MSPSFLPTDFFNEFNESPNQEYKMESERVKAKDHKRNLLRRRNKSLFLKWAAHKTKMKNNVSMKIYL